MGKQKPSTIEVDLMPPHPCVRLQLSNRPVWRTKPDGTSEHALVPDELIKLVHGDECDAELPDYVSSVVFCLSDRDAVSPGEATRLVSPVTDEEAADRAGKIRLPDDFKEHFREAVGEDPTPEDEAASLLQTARLQIEDERSMLSDLPKEALQAIREGHVTVYRIHPQARGEKRFPRRTVGVSDILALTTRKRLDLWREDGDPERYLHLTGKTEDGACRYVAVVYMPSKGSRNGMVILLPFRMTARILAAKHEWIARAFPTFLEMHPSPRFRPRPRGGRRCRRYDDGPAEDGED